MDYKLKIGEREFTLEAGSISGDGAFTVKMGDREIPMKVLAPTPNQIFISTDQGARNLYVARGEEGTWVWQNGRSRFVEDALAEKPRRKSGAGSDGGGEVTPPTPCTVVRIETEVGAKVNKGDALVVVSAMKMEITLPAPYAGTVLAINTEVGAKANPGEILVEIEPEESGEEENGE